MVPHEAQLGLACVSKVGMVGLTMLCFLEDARRGGAVHHTTPTLLSYECCTVEQSAQALLALQAAGIVVAQNGRWRLSRPGAHITLGDVGRAMSVGGDSWRLPPSSHSSPKVALVGTAATTLIDRLTVGDVVDRYTSASAPGGERASEATIDQVADRAGVSRSTVSRVLTSSVKVKPSTRQRVEDAIASLEYQPSLHARELARFARRHDVDRRRAT